MLADCTGTVRGMLLRRVVRRLDEAWLHRDAAFEDAVAGKCVNGNSRAQHQAGYDWLRDGRRVACKSTQLIWTDADGWRLRFSDVKLPTSEREAPFDELLLAAYTPEGVHLFRHDLRTGASSNGKITAMNGQSIQVYGPKREPDWRVALAAIVGKLQDRGCSRLAFIPWDP